MNRHLLLLAAGLLGITPLCGAESGGRKMILAGVDRYRVCEAMFEAVRVVLSYRGEKLSPAYVQGVSGAAFRIAGPCPCAPTCSAQMDTQALVKLLGYEMESIIITGDTSGEVGKLIARIKGEVRAGRPVVVWNAFTSAEWDVVCGFDEEKKQFLGRGSHQGLGEYAVADQTRITGGLGICGFTGAIFIGKKTGKLAARQAELAALEEAVRHARTPGDCFLAEAGDRELLWRFREGLACYEAWVRAFRADPRKVPGGGDRYPLGIYRSTHRAAAAFLREVAPKYPKAQAQLERAAGHFAADGGCLDECFVKLMQGWEGWKEPDPAKAARAATLFLEARGHYAKGIEEIAAALEVVAPARLKAARRPAVLKRTKDAARIEGIPKLAWGQGKECTYIGSLWGMLKVTDHPYSYPDLMGLSGLAFRVRWSNDRVKTQWCHSCAVGEMPDEGKALAERTGWTFPAEFAGPQGRDNEGLRKRLVASINAGRPVLAYPEHWDVALIYGYEDGGKTLLVNDYHGKEMPLRVPIAKLGHLRGYAGEYRQPPPLRQSLRAALEMAVASWRRERHNGGLPDREYWYGDAALAAWIGDVRGIDALPEETRKKLTGLDTWCYAALQDARKAAVPFLRDWSIVVEGEPREAIRKAADLYEQEAKALVAIDWAQPDARRKEAEALEEARRLDAAAIAEFEKALAQPW